VTAKKQWHPVFAELLRPLVESHYQVETNMPVGDVPREADFVLLRRTRAGQLPAAGLWRDLTTWNVLEFKGPTVSPRDDDLELLIELGLGVHRRLNEEQAKQRRPVQGPAAVSFWFLANRLGRRLLRGWGQRLPGLEEHGPGVWRGQLLGRSLHLVSEVHLPVAEASLPLHLIAPQPGEREADLARLVAGRAELLERYGGWLMSLHPAAYEEVEDMVRKMKGGLRPDLSAVIKLLGLGYVIEQAGVKRVIEQIGWQRFVAEGGGVKQLVAKLTPAQRQEIKRLLEE
jgi:hypothetical protein